MAPTISKEGKGYFWKLPQDYDQLAQKIWSSCQICTKRFQGKALFLKGPAYNTGSETNVGIVSARDPAVHREIRKSLSHAFSAKALRLQEEVGLRYMDLFVSQIHKRKDDEKELNLSEWYNWLTFDIIGDLAFGESFDAVESEGHSWISLILSTVHLMAIMEIFRRFPFFMNSFFKKIATILMPKDLKEKSKVHFQNSMQKATRRMKRGNNDRDDFFSHLRLPREKEKGPKITREFILAQFNTLIVAGSETTATFLIGVTYYLLNRPETLRRLQEEIRNAFTSSEDITSDSTAALLYLAAVIEEGLRIYPPVPMGLPRECPGAMIDGHYVPKARLSASLAMLLLIMKNISPTPMNFILRDIYLLLTHFMILDIKMITKMQVNPFLWVPEHDWGLIWRTWKCG
ncbi:uncharacterized protein EAF01_002609 [Botrytis porri]|uniref:uncharacterized protein n=1 Tax=Botrytis porri TaxID=87229 RepID=UPI0019027C80|nr:uncharacterized protein EAF01_002609 [Botrytis porri]KAF7911101.1 hypothetical protein EAF01_002609 [Botrytis porri]